MMFLRVFFAFVSCWVCVESRFPVKSVFRTESSDEEAVEKWRTLENNVKDGVDHVIKQLLPVAMKSNSEIDISSQCGADLLKVLFGVKNLNLWAVKMLDATGKPSGGQFDGVATELGSFDECLALKSPPNDRGYSITGQYCLIDLQLPMPPLRKNGMPLTVNHRPEGLMNFTAETEIMEEFHRRSALFYVGSFLMAVCLPSSCEQEDISQIATAVAEKVGVYADILSCQNTKDTNVDHVQIAVMSIFGIIVGTVLLLTALEMLGYGEDKESVKGMIVSAVSLRLNFRRLMSTEQPLDQTLTFMNGIKTITMAWIILLHTYLSHSQRTLRNYGSVYDTSREFWMQIIINGSPAIDTFLFVTGVLIAYNLVLRVDKHGGRQFNVLVAIIRRAWRLLPSAMLVVGMTLVLPLMGSGPFWSVGVVDSANKCRENAWSIAAFVNNFIPIEKVCLPHFWYISLDMQLFLLASMYLVCLLTFKKRVLSLALSAVVIAISILAPAIITYLKFFPPTVLFIYPDVDFVADHATLIYRAPYTRAGGYFIGLLVGTFLARKRDFHVPKIAQAIGWSLSIACNSAILFGTVGFYRGRDPTLMESTFYAAFCHVGWALGMTWLSLMCATGRGGLVNKFLSWRGFFLTTRISFLAYLIQMLVIFFYIHSMKSPMDATHVSLVWSFFGHCVVTFFLSCMVRLLFESPLLNLEAIFWGTLVHNENTKDQIETNLTEKPALETEHSKV